MIITLATGNPHKLLEISQINPYKEIQFQTVSGKFNPVENGTTFEENAYIKAKEASLIVKGFAFADDTGLCVDALGGAPGLHTARYAPTQEEKINKLITELKGVPFENRTARFICNMVLTDKNGLIIKADKISKLELFNKAIFTKKWHTRLPIYLFIVANSTFLSNFLW